MRKTLLVIPVLLALLACGAEPGREGGPCLEDGSCSWEVLACGPDGRCRLCGGDGELCCEGTTCWRKEAFCEGHPLEGSYLL